MANPVILSPVEGDDPCGNDLKWDMEFMTLNQQYDVLFLPRDEGVVAGAAVSAGAPPDTGDFIARVEGLCSRTKDLRLLSIRAETLWRTRGLSAFADALEDLVAAAELWPDAATGIHPRADEFDGDLGERVAAVGKLLNMIPTLVSIVAWGGDSNIQERQKTVTTLGGVFDLWSDRLEPAFGDDLPSTREAWEALRGLLPPTSSPATGGEDGGDVSAAAFELPPPEDAWELMERAAGLLAEQDRHSPALPVLHLLLIWRSRDILEIADGMRQSGLTMEQLFDSVRKQLAN